MPVDLYPAIDLRGGKVVRLRQGDYADETVYGDDPLGVAESFASAGAVWVHVVDLDAARTGEATNRAVIAEVAARLAGRARVQTGGGVRTIDDAVALRESGVARVVMGSAAVADPSLVNRVADIIDVAVGLDHRNGEIAVHGWTAGSDLSLGEALDRFPRAAAFVITDIARDGMLAGPDVEGLAWAASRTDVPVIASGGVSSLDDIGALAAVPRLAGIITGKALYEGRFDVARAVAVLAGEAAS